MNSIQKGDFAELIYTGEGVIRLEEEVILPDYCPDVARLVRVELTPVVEKSRAYIQEGAVCFDVSGVAHFTVIYTSPEGDTESYSFELPMDSSFKKELSRKTGISSDSIEAFVCPFVSGSGAKPLTSRKLLARGEVRVNADVFANVEYSFYDALRDAGEKCVEPESAERFIASLTGGGQSDCRVEQDIKIPPTLPSGAKVLSCTATMSVDSCSPSSDTVTVFMTANFNVFYLSEETGEREAEFISFCQPIEVRERIECSDCAEDSVCRVRAVTGVPVCKLECDSFGEMRIFHFELPYTLTCSVFENIPVCLVSDVYGIGREVECRFSDVEFMRYIGALSESDQFKKKIGIKSEASSLCGVRGTARVKSVSVGEGGAVARLELSVGAVPRLNGGVSGEINESMELEIPLNLPDSVVSGVKAEDTVCDAVATLSFIDAQVFGTEMEISGEVVLQAQLWEKSRVKFLADVKLSAPVEREKKILFYYPTPSDTLRSVGKRYGVGIETLKTLNRIENGVLPRVLKIFDGN